MPPLFFTPNNTIMEILSNLTRLQIHGILLLLSGLLTRFIIAQRRFRRRGIGGLQHFNSYISALVVMTLEWLFNLLGLLCILLGLLLLLV